MAEEGGRETEKKKASFDFRHHRTLPIFALDAILTLSASWATHVCRHREEIYEI